MAAQFDLNRFIEAQDPVMAQVRLELAAGQKRSHWMWFVFPQLRGLGHRAIAERYAIHSIEEARAYLSDAQLGPRLTECTALVLKIEGRDLRQIFGSPDDMKFHSSMTLFTLADGTASVFRHALDTYVGGVLDHQTVQKLDMEALS